ncbi:cell adhesion molecule CEACAM1-like [Saccoglossus kowalevskii]
MEHIKFVSWSKGPNDVNIAKKDFINSKSQYLSDRKYTIINEHLLIKNIEILDEDQYTCFIIYSQNEGITQPQTHNNINFTVCNGTPPNLTITQQHYSGDVELQCISDQPFGITWQHNGKPLRQQLHVTLFVSTENKSIVKIQNMRKEDEGYYECFASTVCPSNGSGVIDVRFKAETQTTPLHIMTMKYTHKQRKSTTVTKKPEGNIRNCDTS